jgi:hypothetical protein
MATSDCPSAECDKQVTMTTTERTAGHTIRLILGDQLNLQHRWFNEVESSCVIECLSGKD